MNKKPSVWIGGLLVALILIGAAGVTAAYAQDANPPTPPGQPGTSPGPHGGRGLGPTEMQAAADALGMTTDELTSALRNGKTLEQVAEEAGVDLQTVQDAISAAHKEETRAQIQKGLTDNTLSQEKADWLLEGLDKGFFDGPGFGFGFGRPGGRPEGGTPPAASTDKE